MVCPRCIWVIKQILTEMDILWKTVDLGVVDLKEPLSQEQLPHFTTRIESLGFQLLNDSRDKQVEEIKNLLMKVLQADCIEPHFSVRKYLSASISKEYSYLSRLFSDKESTTIEHYFILLKLEKVKELLTYGELSLSEIATCLGYSSVQHLSAQFRKAFGVSARKFKLTQTLKRITLDNVCENSVN